MLFVNLESIKNQINLIRGLSAIPLSLRNKSVEYGLARLVAYAAGLPTATVPNPAAFFDESAKEVKGVLATINESTVISIPAILSLAVVIWRARYDQVYAPFTKDAQALSFAAIEANVGFTFPKEMADFVALSNAPGDASEAIKLSIAHFTSPAIFNDPAANSTDAVAQE